MPYFHPARIAFKSSLSTPTLWTRLLSPLHTDGEIRFPGKHWWLHWGRGGPELSLQPLPLPPNFPRPVNVRPSGWEAHKVKARKKRAPHVFSSPKLAAGLSRGVISSSAVCNANELGCRVMWPWESNPLSLSLFQKVPAGSARQLQDRLIRLTL